MLKSIRLDFLYNFTEISLFFDSNDCAAVFLKKSVERPFVKRAVMVVASGVDRALNGKQLLFPLREGRSAFPPFFRCQVKD